MKRIVGWVCVVGSILAVVAFVALWATHQLSQPSTYVKGFFVPPVVFFYGISLLRASPKETKPV